MGGNKDAKRQAEEEKRQMQARLDAALQVQQKVDPLEERLKTGNMSFLDAVEGKDKPFDIRDSRLGLAPNLALYDSAVNSQDDERMGTGIEAMGAHGLGGGLLSSLLREQRKAKAQQNAAGGLERAFSLRNAEVRGSALPLIGIGQQRNATSLGAISGLYGNASNNYYNLASQPGLLEKLLMGSLNPIGAIGAGYASRSRQSNSSG